MVKLDSCTMKASTTSASERTRASKKSCSWLARVACTMRRSFLRRLSFARVAERP